MPVAVPAAVTPNGLRPYICPTRTVADLVNNLLLLDQALPIHGAQHIEIEGRRRARAVQPVVSHERVKEGRWIGEGEELNAVVIWTRAEQPAAVSVTGAEFSQFLSDVMTAAGLVRYGKQRCKALAARLGDMVMRLRVEPPPKADHFRDATQMVTQGWQLVPVEPTEGMLGAGLRHIDGLAAMPSAYRAMLAAAPQPPVDHLRGATQMTLDEAIEHAEEVAGCTGAQCGVEHAQLAAWLRELRDRRRVTAASSQPLVAEPPVVQEPNGWLRNDGFKAITEDAKSAFIKAGQGRLVEDYTTPLYTRPAPARKPLTDKQIQEIWCSARSDGNQTGPFWFARAIERAHGIT